jgi:hypothetical protein
MAVAEAAKQHAPGLLRRNGSSMASLGGGGLTGLSTGTSAQAGRKRHGVWFRKGNTIVIRM